MRTVTGRRYAFHNSQNHYYYVRRDIYTTVATEITQNDVPSAIRQTVVNGVTLAVRRAQDVRLIIKNNESKGTNNDGITKHFFRITTRIY